MRYEEIPPGASASGLTLGAGANVAQRSCQNRANLPGASAVYRAVDRKFLWPEIVRQRSGVVAIVRQLIAAGMPQHVRVHAERQPCGKNHAVGTASAWQKPTQRTEFWTRRWLISIADQRNAHSSAARRPWRYASIESPHIPLRAPAPPACSRRLASPLPLRSDIRVADTPRSAAGGLSIAQAA